MDWINYHHLCTSGSWPQGSVVRACEELQLSQPTISGQLAKFRNRCAASCFAASAGVRS